MHSNNIQRLLFEFETDCKVLRYRHRLSLRTVHEIEAFARQRVGTSYSVKEAVRSGFLFNVSKQIEENRQFCSRLVAQAYNPAGLFITKKAALLTPEDINRSIELIEVEGCLRKASETEIQFANDRENNPVFIQEEITNSLLREIRVLSESDIQTWNQVFELVLNRPSLDQQVSAIIDKSGYLDLWRGEVDKNFRRYNYDEFITLIQDRNLQLAVAIDEQESELGMRWRYQTNFDFFEEKYRTSPLRTFELMINLYTNLLATSDMRIAVFRKVLDEVTS